MKENRFDSAIPKSGEHAVLIQELHIFSKLNLNES